MPTVNEYGWLTVRAVVRPVTDKRRPGPKRGWAESQETGGVKPPAGSGIRTTKSWTDLGGGKNGQPLRCHEPLWQTALFADPEPPVEPFTGVGRPAFSRQPSDTLRQQGPRKIPLARLHQEPPGRLLRHPD